MGCSLNKRTIKRLARPMVVGVAMGAILLTPYLWIQQAAMADFGPCVDKPGTPQYLNTLSECSSGVCTGDFRIAPLQTICQNVNEDECTEVEVESYIHYDPMPVDLGWITFTECIVANPACILCIALAAGICTVPPWLQCVLGVTVCGFVCYGLTPPPCCWTSCVQDTTTRFSLMGGTRC